MGEERFYLGRKDKAACVFVVKQRLHADSVTGKKELLFLFLQLPLLLVQLRLQRLQRLLLLERFLLLLAQLLGHAGEVGQGALHVL